MRQGTMLHQSHRDYKVLKCKYGPSYLAEQITTVFPQAVHFSQLTVIERQRSIKGRSRDKELNTNKHQILIDDSSDKTCMGMSLDPLQWCA